MTEQEDDNNGDGYSHLECMTDQEDDDNGDRYSHLECMTDQEDDDIGDRYAHLECMTDQENDDNGDRYSRHSNLSSSHLLIASSSYRHCCLHNLAIQKKKSLPNFALHTAIKN